MLNENSSRSDWKTKPTDRFILKWIKCRLSARITPKLISVSGLRPWMVTIAAAGLGVLAGFLFALGWAFLAGLTAAFSQILDGVDGQLARLTGRESSAGALLDSVVDRYADGVLVIGLVAYLARIPFFCSLWELLVVGAFAFIGSSLISYSSARAESLGIDLGKPTLASKGTRVSAIAVSALLTPLWQSVPVIALFYLALSSNIVVVKRLLWAFRQAEMWEGGDKER